MGSDRAPAQMPNDITYEVSELTLAYALFRDTEIPLAVPNDKHGHYWTVFVSALRTLDKDENLYEVVTNRGVVRVKVKN